MSSSFPSRGLHDWRFLWSKSTTEAGTAECFFFCWSVEIALWQSSKGWFLMEYYLLLTIWLDYNYIQWYGTHHSNGIFWRTIWYFPHQNSQLSSLKTMRYQASSPIVDLEVVVVNPNLTKLIPKDFPPGCLFTKLCNFSMWIFSSSTSYLPDLNPLMPRRKYAMVGCFWLMLQVHWEWCVTKQTNGYIFWIVLVSQVHVF